MEPDRAILSISERKPQMRFEFHLDTDPKEMDAFVTASEQNSLFQCSPWAGVKTNWDHLFASATEGGVIVATALVLIRRMPLGRTLFYIPRGPVMNYEDPELVEFFLSSLKQEARRHHAIAVRFDPSILLRRYSYKDRSEKGEPEHAEVIALLQKLGARHRGFTVQIAESTQPRFNAEMDVTPDYRDHLEHKTAKCIRAAEHHELEILSGPEAIPQFSVAMHYTEVRKKVALRSESYFSNMMEVYGDHAICLVTVLNFRQQIERLQSAVNDAEQRLAGQLTKKERTALAQQCANDRKELARLQEDYAREQKEEVVTCGILAVYNDRLMELFYMGNHPDYLRLYSSYLLYAKCLDICAEKGIRRCSFGGIEGTLDDGLTLFKSNWLMNVEEYIGEFNIVLDPFMYRAFDQVYPFLLKQAARLRGKGGD